MNPFPTQSEGTVLIIDDNPNNIKVIATCLEDHGFTVLIARNGTMGVQRANFSQPDLILLDIVMPDVDGFETCRRLKADPETSEIPIIFMTALTDIEQKVQGFAVGAVDYITKPFQEAEALARVHTHIHYRRLMIQAERQRLSHELHDSVTQSLYSQILLTNGWAKRATQGNLDTTQIALAFEQLGTLAKQALKETRLLLHQLRPNLLRERGLVDVLQQRLDSVEQRANINAQLCTSGNLENLRPKLSEQLFFIAQEALNNALRHARATAITIRINRTSTALTLTVEDNGQGFDVDASSGGQGLTTMQERAATVNGQVQIQSSPQKGTRVTVVIPTASQPVSSQPEMLKC